MEFSSTWQPVRLGELIAIKHGWPFRSELFSEELTGRPIVVSIGNFEYTGGFRFDATKTKEYRGTYPKEYELTPGDILLIMTCQTSGGEILGIPGRIPDDGRFYLHNQRMGKVVITRPDSVDSNYLYWLFLWPPFNRHLFLSCSGTKILHTSPGRILDFRFELPPLSIQRRIADILGALDTKIEVNRRINRALEDMAQALFKHWFVDFGPFQDGQFVEKISSLGELFPDSKNCVITGPFGSNLHASDYRDRGIPLILVQHVNTGRVSEEGLPLVGAHKFPELERYLLKVGDIVFTRVGVVGQSAYVHRRNEGWMISGQMLRVRLPDNDLLNARYLAQVFMTDSFIRMVESHAVGSTRPSLNTQLLKAFRFLIPPIELQNRYTNIVSEWDAEIQNNLDTSRKLQEMRDYLLPRLLSGEISVEAAEEGVANAG